MFAGCAGNGDNQHGSTAPLRKSGLRSRQAPLPVLPKRRRCSPAQALASIDRPASAVVALCFRIALQMPSKFFPPCAGFSCSCDKASATRMTFERMHSFSCSNAGEICCELKTKRFVKFIFISFPWLFRARLWCDQRDFVLKFFTGSRDKPLVKFCAYTDIK